MQAVANNQFGRARRQVDRNGVDDDTDTVTNEDFESILALVPDDVLLLASPVDDYIDRISADERLLVQNAVSKRQKEFSTGRWLARHGIQQLGLSAVPILQGAVNEPVWPAGVTGSITHTANMCMVALCRDEYCAGLGIDLEARPAEFSDLEHLILSDHERREDENGGYSGTDRVRLLFSAKESLYKAIYPNLGRFVDFQEICIEVDGENAEYAATAVDDDELDAEVRSGFGRFRVTESFVFTLWMYH
jgi:enterobactin synthetase component D